MTSGSLVNDIYQRSTKGQPEPEVGMPVTFLGYTDRNPGTIVQTFTIGAFRYFQATHDHYQRTDDNGMSEMQTYDYTPRPKAQRYTYRQKHSEPDAPWRQVNINERGNYVNVNGADGIRLGVREKYHDFSF